MSWLEFSANLFTVLSIWLARRNSIQTWWTGVIGSILFAELFRESRLYADVTLQVFFVVTSLYGWWWWSGKDRVERPITHAGVPVVVTSIALGTVLTFGYGYLLHHFTNADYPYWDSGVMMFSIAAQILLMQRKIETWWLWFIVDILAVPLYAKKELYVTAFLYFAFLINAGFGWAHWKRELEGRPT